jgi:hypothetical protein
MDLERKRAYDDVAGAVEAGHSESQIRFNSKSWWSVNPIREDLQKEILDNLPDLVATERFRKLYKLLLWTFGLVALAVLMLSVVIFLLLNPDVAANW